MSPILQRQLVGIGWRAAAAAAVLTALWILTMIVQPPAAGSGGPAEQLRLVREAGAAGTVGIALALPLAFLLVPVWLALAAIVWDRRPALGLLAACFGLLYAPFVTLNYWSQLTVVRGLAHLAASEPAAAQLYRLFAFDELTSFGYASNVLGYAVWGLAGLSIAGGLWATAGRLQRATGLLFGLTGILAIGGALGFALRSFFLELGVLASGVAFLPSIILAAILLRRWLMAATGTVTEPAGSAA